MKKSGAIELSIGTIVIIVLAMSMLILGIVLVKNIFSGSVDIADMTIDQIKNQVSKMFGDDKRLVIYPDTRLIEIKGGKVGGFGIGIKNLLQGNSAVTSFTYEVLVSDTDIQKKCGFSEQQALNWMVTGRTEKLEIAPGESEAGKVLIEIPDGTNLCTFRYRVNVKQADGKIYDSDFVDVTIKA
ncbi:MAG: hypothetical protein WC548_03255 [Candidatus Pacearchaeota archaeon]